MITITTCTCQNLAACETCWQQLVVVAVVIVVVAVAASASVRLQYTHEINSCPMYKCCLLSACGLMTRCTYCLLVISKGDMKIEDLIKHPKAKISLDNPTTSFILLTRKL